MITELPSKKNLKLYLARFTRRENGKIFYKIGYTGNYDAGRRFLYEEYSPWDVKILASAYGPRDLVLEAERELLTRYPKNLYIHEKINGVKEIFITDTTGLENLFNYYREKSNLWYNIRHDA